MKLTLITFKDECEWTHNNMQTIVSVTSFGLLRIKCQEISFLNIAPRSVMIKIS